MKRLRAERARTIGNSLGGDSTLRSSGNPPWTTPEERDRLLRANIEALLAQGVEPVRVEMITKTSFRELGFCARREDCTCGCVPTAPPPDRRVVTPEHRAKLRAGQAWYWEWRRRVTSR